MTRRVLLITHTGRPEAVTIGRDVAQQLIDAGIEVRSPADEAAALDCASVVPVPVATAAEDVELVLVLGGDGTLLRAAEVARPAGAPLLGVNLGHIGFLAEAEQDDVDDVVKGVLSKAYVVEERITLDVSVHRDDDVTDVQWALNDATVEKIARQRMLEVIVEVDGRPLSRWGGDGVVLATPTGSTAYAFSAGGPVVWPDVAALLLVPISAHALFARPLVVAPDSVLAVELAHGAGALFCDGRRMVELPEGARVEVRRGRQPVRLARLHAAPFTDRLVGKFGLSVHGWRGRSLDRP
jgi:NAD+ kinase